MHLRFYITMDYEDKLYYILKTAREMPSPSFKEIRDAYATAKLLKVPVEAILPDLFSTNIAFIYVVNGKIVTDIYNVPSITFNIEQKILEYEDKGEDLIGFIHTHSPESVMPSVSDFEAILFLQQHFPECVSAIKRKAEGNITVFAFQINENIAFKYWENFKKRYKNALVSIDPDFVFKVPDAFMSAEGSKYVVKELPVYDDRSSTIIDLTVLEMLLNSDMLKYASYNKLR